MIQINKRQFVHIVKRSVCSIARECNEHTCSGLEWHTHRHIHTCDIDSPESVQRESPLFISIPHPPLSFCLSFSFLFSFCDSGDSSCLGHNERLWGIDCTVSLSMCVCALMDFQWLTERFAVIVQDEAWEQRTWLCKSALFLSSLFSFSFSMASFVESHFPFIKFFFLKRERKNERDSERGNGRVGQWGRRFVWQ